jgi:hypothetical protein
MLFVALTSPFGYQFWKIAAIALVLAVPARRWGMLRLLASVAYAAVMILLVVSSRFRNAVVPGLARAANGLSGYAPYFYLGLTFVLFGALFLFVSRELGSRSR